jgi:hypothetical protein
VISAVTNNSRALQGVWTVDGLAFIEPGETRELAIDPDHADRTAALPFLSVEAVEAKPASEPKPPARPRSARSKAA